MADTVVVIHLTFVCFVVGGGIAVRYWPWLIWVHLPAVGWGVGIEWWGGVCPLTFMEQWLRGRAGQFWDENDFLVEYLEPLLYPAGMTRTVQVVLGVLALGVNVAVYVWVFKRPRLRV